MSQSSFLVHKPINVLSSKCDSLNWKNNKPQDKTTIHESRVTVYDIAKKAGYPTNFGLVGRLDYETSGIMLMTSDNTFASAIRDPIEPDDSNNDDSNVCDDHCSSWNPPSNFDMSFKEKDYVVKVGEVDLFFSLTLMIYL